MSPPRRSNWLVLAMALALSSMAGCASAPSPQGPARSIGSSPVSASSPTGTSSSAPESDLADGEGDFFLVGRRANVSDARPAPSLPGLTELYSLPTLGPDGLTTGVIDLAADGSVLVSRSEQPTFEDGIDIAQSEVGIYSPATGFEAFDVAPGADVVPGGPRQSADGDFEGGVSAWTETSGTDVWLSNWRIFAHSDGSTRLLAVSEQVLDDDLPGINGPTVPTVGPSEVFWQTGYPRGDKGSDGHYSDFGVEVMARSIDGTSELGVVAKDAIYPAATNSGGVAFVRAAPFDPTITRGTYEICESVDGREATLVVGPLPEDGAVASLATSGDRLLWVVTQGHDPAAPESEQTQAGEATLYSWERGSRSIDELTMIDAPPSISVSDGYAAWGNGSGNFEPGEYLLDLEGFELWKLGGLQGFSVALVRPPYLMWTSAGPSTDPIEQHVARFDP